MSVMSVIFYLYPQTYSCHSDRNNQARRRARVWARVGNREGESQTSQTSQPDEPSLPRLAERRGSRNPVPDGKLSLGVDGLAFAVDLPLAVVLVGLIPDCGVPD